MNHPLKPVADHLASKGRYGDTELIHVNKDELRGIASLVPGGKLTVNPHTGLQEAFLPALLAPLIGGLAGGWALPAIGWGSAALGAGLGSGLGSFAATGDLAKGVTSGLLGYGLGSATDLLASGTEGIAGAADGAKAASAANSAGAVPGSALNPMANLPQPTDSATWANGVGGVQPGAAAASASGYTPASDALRTMGDADLGGYGGSLPIKSGAGLNVPADSWNPLDKLGRAAENSTNPGVLKNTFWTNATRTTMPIAGGIIGGMMLDNQSQGAPPPYQYQTNYSYPGNQGTGRRYQYHAPDPMGREQQYFYAGGGEIDPGRGKYEQDDKLDFVPRKPEGAGLKDRGRTISPRQAEEWLKNYNEYMRQGGGGRGSLSSPSPFNKPEPPITRFADGGQIERFYRPREYEDRPRERFYQPRDRFYEDYPSERLGPPRDPYYEYNDRPGDTQDSQPQSNGGGMILRGGRAPERFAKGGYIGGPGGGLDDAIPAVIDGRQPAKLSSGEYVVPAHAVSALGNGSTEHGVRELDKMVDRTMQSKYGTKNRKPRPIKAENMMAGLGAMKKGAGKKAPGPFEYQAGGIIDYLFGSKEKPQDPGRSWDMPVQQVPWPTKDDVEAARSYKEQWGNPNEQTIDRPRIMNPYSEPGRYIKPGTGLNILPKAYATDMHQTGDVSGSKVKDNANAADRLYANQMAAAADPVAYLGADHKRVYVNDPPGEFNLGGFYQPHSDNIWWSAGKRSDAVPVHEYMHRGLEIMRKESPESLKRDGFPKVEHNEEQMVRRMMKERYGPIEYGTSGDEWKNHVDPAVRAVYGEQGPEMKEMEQTLKKVRKKAHEMVAKKVIDKAGGVYARGGRVK